MNNTENIKEDYSPYCPRCGGCGEDGCCSALNCKQHPDGHYCETYLKDLKFGYLMDIWVENELVDRLPQDLKDEFNKKWDEVWNRIYNNNETNNL